MILLRRRRLRTKTKTFSSAKPLRLPFTTFLLHDFPHDSTAVRLKASNSHINFPLTTRELMQIFVSHKQIKLNMFDKIHFVAL